MFVWGFFDYFYFSIYFFSENSPNIYFLVRAVNNEIMYLSFLFIF